jgi:tetratricopeptide (TPR) repeat protein
LAEIQSREVQAISLCEQGKVDEGIGKLSDLISQYPCYASAYNNRAQAWMMKRELKRAIQDLDSAVEYGDSAVVLSNVLNQ